MIPVRRLITCGALLAAVIWSGSTNGALIASRADGWHTWQVDEADASTTMCCYSRMSGTGSQARCLLEGHRMTWSDDSDCAAAPGTSRIYVHMVDGLPEDIFVLSSFCPVALPAKLVDHGLVTADENLGWFRTIIEDRRLSRKVRKRALFALVQSNSSKAYAYIDKLLSRS
jgi:hypothetical protein